MRRSGLLAVAVLGLSGCGPTNQVRILSLGDPCTPGDATAACAGGLCVAIDSASGFCTQTCDLTCPDNFLCQAAGHYGRICRKLTGCKVTDDCPAGHLCDAATGNCYVKATRDLCAPCQDSAQCPAGGACFSAIGSGEQFCTIACGAGDACPPDAECKEIPAGPEGAPLKQCVPVTMSCDSGRGLCAGCQGDNECGGPFDLCVRNVVSGETFCGRDCNPKKNLCPTVGCDPEQLGAAQNPDCPSGFSCTNIGGPTDDPSKRGPFQCVPNSNTCQGYCEAAGDRGQISSCGTGRVCAGNACQSAADGRECSGCSNNDDCRRGGFTENRCIVNQCPNCPFKGESFCATPCADDAACVRTFGVGFVCKPVDDPTAPGRKYCMPQRGTCKSGLGRLGDNCAGQQGQDCVTGLCIEAGNLSYCSSPCTADAECGDTRFRCCETAGTGYDCSPAHRSATGPLSGSGLCAPLGGLFGDDCTPGRAPCQSGTCLDLGTVRVCTMACPVAGCPDGFSCRSAQSPDGTQHLDVCFPEGGGQPGASCAFGPAACSSGMCIRKDSGPICTEPCTADADCHGSGWVCAQVRTVTDSSVQACLPPALGG